jgi:hypothetical protein
MKLATDALRSALKTVAPAVQVNAHMPALSGVRITATDDALTFATTDYQTWIETRAACEPEIGSDGWSVIVSHRLATIIAGVIRAKEVTLEPDGASLRIAAGRSFWKAPQIAGDPPATPAAPAQLAEVDASTFAAMVGKVAIAASANPTAQPALHVVELSSVKGGIRLAASDRHRLHQAGAEASTSSTTAIYPEASSLLKIASSLSGTVTVLAEKGGDLFGLSDESTTVLTRTVDVQKWLKPDESITRWRAGVKATTTVPATLVVDAVKAAQAVLPDDSIGVRIEITADAFTVGALDENAGGSASADVDDYNHDGPGLTAFIRSALLLPALALAGDEVIELAWVAPKGALLISVPGQVGTFVVMGLSVPGAG